MANNSYNNKIQLSDGTVLIDLTSDTVEADKLLEGFTAHNASGEAITGTMFQVPLDPIAYDYEPGYTANGTFKYENSTNNHSDVYEVKAGHYYALILGETVGTRFRAAVIPSNPVGTLVDIPGTDAGRIVGVVDDAVRPDNLNQAVLQIEFIFNSHAAGNSADIIIAFDSCMVGVAGNISFSNCLT